MLYFAAAALVSAELHSGFFDSFLNIMFPERVVIVLFAVFAFLMFKYNENKKTYILVLAFISAFIATYFKETVFAFFIVYAGWTLLFKKDCNRTEKIFSYALIVNGVVFLLLYYVFAWKSHGNIYRADVFIGIWQLMNTVFRNSALLLFIFPFAAVRLFKCLALKQKSVSVVDPLLAASAIYALEYLVLGYSSNYYYAPAITAGAIPVIFYAVRIAAQKRYAGAAVFVLLCLVPIIEIPSVSAIIHNTIIERTKVMPGLRMIAGRYLSGGKIYWFQPWNKDEKIFNLTELYINFILDQEMGQPGEQNNSVLTVTETVPELRDNDIFLYMAMNKDQFNADSATLSGLKEHGFEFCQFQTGYMIFTKGKCVL